MADNDESKMIIAEIRATIDSWKSLPAKPSEFIDPKKHLPAFLCRVLIL
jgi:ABC-type Fe3+-citrate transport system substrate-binding protein